MVHGLSRSVACGVFPDQGSNLYVLCSGSGFLNTGLPGNSFSIVSFDVLNLKKFHEVQFVYIYFLLPVPLISYPSCRCQIQCHSICSVSLF